MNYDPENPVVVKAKEVFEVVKRQALDTLALIRRTEILKDRDVQIALAVVLASILFTSKVIFGAALGYLVYHYVRRDDHVRNAVEALDKPAD